MATQEEVILEILARTDQAIASVERLNKAFDDQTKKAEESTKKSGNGFLEMAAKIGVAYQAMTKFLTAYEDQAKSDARLNMAIKNNTDEYSRQGKTVNQLTDEYKKFAQQQQEATGICDEQTQQLQSLLVSLGTAPDQVNRVTAALQDMAAGAGVDATMLARAWSRMQEAPEEALTAFSRAGLKLKQEQLAGMSVEQQRIYVLTELEKKFKGQAAAMAQATGGLAQARAAFNDAMEVAGELLTNTLQPLIQIWNAMPGPLKGIAVAVGALTVVFRTFNSVLKANPFLAVASTILTVAGALSTLTDETEAYKKSIDQVASLNNQAANAMDSFARQSGAVDALKNLKYGTDQYRKSVNELLRQNPDLVNMGITAMSSYDDIREAVYQLNKESMRRIALQKIEEQKEQRGILVRKIGRFGATQADYDELNKINEQIAISTFGGDVAQAAVANFARVAGRTVHTEVKDGIVTGAKDAKEETANEIGKAFTDEDFKKQEEEAAQKLKEDMSAAISTSFDIATDIIKGDWKSAITQTFSSIDPLLGGIVSAGSNFADALDSLLRGSAKTFSDSLNEAIQSIQRDQSWASTMEDIFGELNQQSIDASLSAAENALSVLSSTWNNELVDSARLNFAGMTQEQIAAIRNYLKNTTMADGSSIMDYAGWTSRDTLETRKNLADIAGITEQQAQAFIGMYRMGQPVLDMLENVITSLGDIKNAKISDSMNEYKLALEDVQHKLATGQMTEEEANIAQIEIYDQMIAALDGMIGAEKLLNQLEEARYKLLQDTGDQLDANLQTEKMQALLAEQSALERQIATGAVRAGTYDTVMRQQDILQRIIAQLRREGASSSTIATYEDQLAALMTTTLGSSGFAALAGTGAAVTLPSYATARSGASMVTTNNNNTTANNTISLNANLPPDIISYIMREVQRSSGGRNILGGYN